MDISDVFERKLALAGCYRSQVGPGLAQGNEFGREPLTRLSHKRFVHWFRALHAYYGFKIGVEYGEAYCLKNPVPVPSPLSALR